MRILVIENFQGTPLGQVGAALREAGAELDIRQAFRGQALPVSDAGFDAMIALGGGQNALDDAGSPWLPQAVGLVRAFGAADKAVLGICLGSQLVARAYGGENILGRPLEFGWQEIRPTDAGRADPLLSTIGPGAPIFHWHEDTFTLPPGAAHLAVSEMTENQAFRIGRAVYGIQFHFEADRGLVEEWNSVFAGEIATHTPDWPNRHPAAAERHGPAADAAGQRIAEAWVRLDLASSRPQSPAILWS